MKKTNKFPDQVVWITGASSGIGRALALVFAREGTKIAVSARRKDLLESSKAGAGIGRGSGKVSL